MDFSEQGGDTQTILKLKGDNFFKKIVFHTLASVLPNLMKCVLPNTILKKCPSEHNILKKCPSEHKFHPSN